MNRSGRLSSKENFRVLMVGASALAMNLFTLAPAYAQDAETADEAVDEVVATGIRQSIIDAASIKRNADTFVDAITASDIGALPDRSVSEALQRVPGVSIIRFAGPNDPDHFAVEGSGVVIRGLPLVRSELNGRDVFGASGSGVLGFEDVSPELLGSVQVFKNQSADLIEGGAAGTIDLRTRLPFDKDGPVVAYSLELNYGDLREAASPAGSFLLSNNWDTKAGRFGVLFNASASELLSQADGVQISAFEPANVNGQDVFIPAGGGVRRQEFDRNRRSFAGALQWESPDQKILATAQFLRADSTLVWGENVIETVADNTQGTRGALDATDFVFDEDGVFQSGTITDNSHWRGPNGTAALVGATGGQQLNLFRERLEDDVTTDYAFNVKYAPTDNLRFNFDAQYIDASSEIIDLTLHTSFFAPINIDQSGGGTPEITFLPPAGQDASFLSDPSSFFLRSQLDHTTQNDADSLAFRGDVEYDFSQDGWLKSVRAGVRYSDQDTTVRQSDFNWGNISEVWTGRDIQGNSGGNFDDFESLLLVAGNSNPELESLVNGLFGGFDFEGFGGLGVVPTYVGPSVRDFQGFQDTISNLLATIGGSPSGLNVLTERPGVIAGTPFLPSEIGVINRETFAAYTRVDFGQDNFLGTSFSLDGNIGIRYVNTDRVVDSSLEIDAANLVFGQIALCSATGPLPEGQSRPGFCDLPNLAELQTFFGDGTASQTTTDLSYDEWLPSLNLKLDLGNSQILRFAASRTLSRPDINQLNQRLSVQTLPDVQVPDGAGGFDGVFQGFIGNSTGNATLTPQISTNLDLSWEWYFNEAGSLTIAGFYKDIDDFITNAPVGVNVTNNGVDLTVLRNTEANVDENATLKGVEVAYQQFYDFLPGLFSGLGTQFNYTYIDADGVAATLDPAFASDDPPVAEFAVDAGEFPRVSEHNVNAVALYEKGPVQARVAYNWRSEFQLTPRDVIFPFASIYQPATGQLDGSIFYDINENLKIGLQGVNLLNDITETEQSINEEGVLAPRSFFRNDRRFTAILRATF